jgi:methanethiol S-methyltransferase
MGRIAVFLYGVVCYAIFFGTFLYAMGFVTNFGVPKSIDGPATMPFAYALGINLALLALFAVQHSVMARPAFKKAWTKIVPEPAERSTYVLFSSLALIALFVFWQPMGIVIWDIENNIGRAIMIGLGLAGWLTVLVTTFLINHFDLFGLRQVWLYLRGRVYTPLEFRTPTVYKHVRHPLYVGWMMAFWFTPTMTLAHLTFALMTTGYMLAAIPFEERDLITFHGEKYEAYRRSVPKFIPRFGRKAATEPLNEANQEA